MNLMELEPAWCTLADATGKSWWEGERDGVALTAAQADGIRFLCPKCFRENGGPIGTHSIVCWFTGRVPNDIEPGPGRWTPQGGDFSDLTLRPSIHLTGGGCGWHGFVTNGEVTDA